MAGAERWILISFLIAAKMVQNAKILDAEASF